MPKETWCETIKC